MVAIKIGDGGDLTFYSGKGVHAPKSFESTQCEFGGGDRLLGAGSDVAYLVGGGHDDHIQGGDGMDIAFGDHAIIHFYEDQPFKLKFATTSLGNCTDGSDYIALGSSDDLAFGGGMGDVIYGNAGQDILFGDFGQFNAEKEFLPGEYSMNIKKVFNIDFDLS